MYHWIAQIPVLDCMLNCAMRSNNGNVLSFVFIIVFLLKDNA